MRIAIHQPTYLPWLGYLQRMAQVDCFILLDHVQFERRNYQNRTRILLDGLPRWLTVPVHQRSQLERLMDKTIDNGPGDGIPAWAADQLKTLRHSYRDAPFREEALGLVRPVLEQRWDALVELDLAMLAALRRAFGIRTPMLRSSTLAVSGARSDLILNLCRRVGATHYLAGLGGSRDYLDRSAFAEAGVRIEWQRFTHPTYPQPRSTQFVPGLSALDLLMAVGTTAARQLLAAPPPEAESKAAGMAKSPASQLSA